MSATTGRQLTEAERAALAAIRGSEDESEEARASFASLDLLSFRRALRGLATKGALPREERGE